MRLEKEPKPGGKRLCADILAGTLLILVGSASLAAQTSTWHRRLSPTNESLTAPTIFAADCATPKATFNLGETVCAKATGLNGLRLQWVNVDGFALRMTNITSDSQTDSFVLPTADQSTISGFGSANNLGRWRLNATTLRNSVSTAAFFTVKDPKNPRVDLSIVKNLLGSTIPQAGDAVQFFVTIVNNGPDDAANVHFADTIFSNAAFNSITQTSGPSFTCSAANCRIASFANGAVATFTVNFTSGGGGGVLQNTATVSSDTIDLNTADNSSSSWPFAVGTTGPPPTCTLVVTGPPAVTLNTGAQSSSCDLIVSNLDATFGIASATDNCPLVGPVTRSGVPVGNDFPVGVTVLTYTAKDTDGNTASAIQQVTVVDNTPPAIICPASITLEPTCPSGAIATWSAPVGTDNCPGAMTAQTAGPGSGSLFPIGTTSVAYSVTDASGNQASCSFTVTVLTPVATIQALQVSVSNSSLTGPQKQGLLPKLDAVLSDLGRGNTRPACQVLSAFMDQVQSFVSTGKISAAQGQAWINSATHVTNAIGCTNNPCT